MLAPSIQRLVQALRKLPGVGEKTATRYALHLLYAAGEDAEELAQALTTMKQSVRPCSRCYQMSDTDPCAICASTKRNPKVLCAVEDQPSLIAIEKAGAFTGLYHVLGGRISPLAGKGPDQLRMRELVARVAHDGVTEVIVATAPNADGDATALYIKRLLEPVGVAVTRIARGVPSGSEIEFADALTLGNAIHSRARI